MPEVALHFVRLTPYSCNIVVGRAEELEEALAGVLQGGKAPQGTGAHR